MKEKRLEQTDADAFDEDEEPTKRPRVKFVTLQPGGDDPADAIDDEIPGSVRANVEPLVLDDVPFNPYDAGDTELSVAHMASDPGWARAQRKLLRMRDQDQHAMEAVVQGEEKYDQPEEQYNEAGDAMEPFHLKKEREEGYMDGEGNYIEYDRPDEQDAWLDSIEDQVEGTEGDASGKLPYPNEPVAEDPPPLPARDLRQARQALAAALQPGESVTAALRRLAGAGAVMDKFGDKGEAEKVWRERMHSGRTVAPGNEGLFDKVTEAAEVLFDHGETDIYSATREALQAGLEQERQQEAAPAAAAPTAAEAAAAAAAVAGAATTHQTLQAVEGQQGRSAEGKKAEQSHLVTGTGEGAGGGDRHALRSERQPAPAAAALPPEGMASAPGTEHEARGPHQEGAVHGFAAELVQDVLDEMPVSALPPQEVEAGLGLPFASPTAVEYHNKALAAEGKEELSALAQLHGQVATGGPSPLKAALDGTFATRPGEERGRREV
ncbi:hypothetical protein N2152v2_009882 [Parachlorella kessleri]